MEKPNSEPMTLQTPMNEKDYKIDAKAQQAIQTNNKGMVDFSFQILFLYAHNAESNHLHYFKRIGDINKQLAITHNILSASKILIFSEDKNYGYHHTCCHYASRKCRASNNQTVLS